MLLEHWGHVDATECVISLSAFSRSLGRLAGASDDDRAPRAQLDALAEAVRNARKDARRALWPLARRGLELRANRFLVPVVVGEFDHLTDWLAWRNVQLWLGLLRVGRPTGSLAVCDGCTLVFRSTRRDVRYCSLCSKRPAAGAFPIAGPLRTRGDRMEVRVPVTAAPESHMLVGWKRPTIVLWAECGRHFLPERATARTCSARCRQAQHRRAT